MMGWYCPWVRVEGAARGVVDYDQFLDVSRTRQTGQATSVNVRFDAFARIRYTLCPVTTVCVCVSVVHSVVL